MLLLGEAAGLVRKLCGTLYLSEGTPDKNECLDNNPLETYSTIDDLCTLWQGIYDLNRYGILGDSSSSSIIYQEASMTAQALSYSLQKYLDEHYNFIVQLEDELRRVDKLTLQILWHKIQNGIESHHVIALMIKDIYQPSPFNALQSTLQGASIFKCIYKHYQSFSGYVFRKKK